MPTKVLTAVIDTSVLYSSKKRAVVVGAIQQERLIGIWSPNIIAELFRIITITWIAKKGHGRPSRDALSVQSQSLMEVLLASLALVDTGPRDDRNYPHLRDIGDLHLIAAGKFATADVIVSQNTRDFPAAGKDGTHRYDRLEFVTYETLLIRLGIEENAVLSALDLSVGNA